MSNESDQTLGQKIDAVLEPLYAEAEQHRATIALVSEQQQALQVQIDSANVGLAQIESRMAEVVRSLAAQEPVIAAVVGEASVSADQAPATEAPAAMVEPAPTQLSAPAPSSELEQELEPEPAPEPEDAAPPTPASDADVIEAAMAPSDEVVSTPTPATSAAQAASSQPATDGLEETTIELDPAADAEAVGEAAALLDALPSDAEPEPEVDLAAAAERAAAAAKQLRDKAATK